MSELSSFETMRKMALDMGYDLSLEDMDQLFQQYLERIKTDLYLSRTTIMKDCIYDYLSSHSLSERVKISSLFYH